MLKINNLHVSIKGKEILKVLIYKLIEVKYTPLWDLMEQGKAHWLQ
jgi:hypothetical protein